MDMKQNFVTVTLCICGVLCVIVRFAVLAELSFVTDRHADGRTDTRPQHNSVAQ